MGNATESKHLNTALEFYEQHKEEYVRMLKEHCKIPSISFAGYPATEVARSAEFVKTQLIEAGLENVELLRSEDSHPHVTGNWRHAPGAPTVLVYAHHDVQPPLREEAWKSKPFEPVERAGRLYCRGADDNKSGVAIIIASIASFLKTSGALPLNLAVLVEGEEEIGSQHLEAVLAKYREQLSADCLVVLDGGNYETGLPSITVSLRGLVALRVSVTAMDHPLHSGTWGGPIPDPVMALCKMLGKLVDDQGRLAFTGMARDAEKPSGAQVRDMQSLGMTDAQFKRESGVYDGVKLFGNNYELLQKMWYEPSLAINTIEAGSRKTAGNVIMDSAWTRIGLRLAPGMDGHKAIIELAAFLRKNCPHGLKITIEPEERAVAWKTNTSHPVFEIAREALTRGYKKKPVYMGCGGSIGFINMFTAAFGPLPLLIMGPGDPAGNAHSENESLALPELHKAVRSQIHLLALLGERAKEWKTQG